MNSQAHYRFRTKWAINYRFQRFVKGFAVCFNVCKSGKKVLEMPNTDAERIIEAIKSAFEEE